MTTPEAREDELSRQNRALYSAVGAPGGGKARYAAAMFFYQRGDISARMLEIFRRCCNLDNEDPFDLACFEGLTSNDFGNLKARRI